MPVDAGALRSHLGLDPKRDDNDPVLVAALAEWEQDGCEGSDLAAAACSIIGRAEAIRAGKAWQPVPWSWEFICDVIGTNEPEAVAAFLRDWWR